ncbi:hypothetical protein BDV97DRAFT_358451 [Delphinella strobiligena]|nr:hypothetical protein BDV97DRAFT_358451 [Delphinella strobiligena]
MLDERSPLLQFPGQSSGQESDGFGNHHLQFCKLVGVEPMNLPDGVKFPKPDKQSLYRRALRQHSSQRWTYLFTATLSNGLLLTQVVLRAALTALGASDSSRVLITVFGALNTVIAGLIAYLKSRGQPMRARMYRDDLERVVDEIENSAIMWLGISHRVHGYDAIDTEDQVTVRSEVARLTRLYDRAIRTNTMNDPDMYAAGGPSDAATAALRSRPVTSSSQSQRPISDADAAPVPVTTTPPAAPTPLPAEVTVPPDPDVSPATKAPEVKPSQSADDSKAPGNQTDDTTTQAGPSNAPTIPTPTPT